MMKLLLQPWVRVILHMVFLAAAILAACGAAVTKDWLGLMLIVALVILVEVREGFGV